MTQITEPAAPDAGAAAAARWRELDAELVSPAYARYSDLVVERAQGAHLFTVDGRDVLDFGCGIAVTNLGHNHPDVVAAVHRQVDLLWHTSVTALHPRAVELAEALVRVSPEGLDQVFFCNSGAEAIEGAIKLARKATGRSELIAFHGAFHGRTYGAVTLTASKARYHAGIGPLLPGVHHVDYGVTAPLRRLFAAEVDPGDVAAIVVEPVLGEAGFVVPPAGFLPELRAICDAHGILLVVDEVQTGFARTGKLFAVEHSGVRPDVMTLAKALGNGLPIAAFLARGELMRAWSPGDHGTTFGGNPVACAAAVEVLHVIARDGLCDRAARLGAATMERLRGWQQWAPLLHEVRGLGLMIGVEMREPDGSAARQACKAWRLAALRRGLLVLGSGTEENVMRLIPPLTIPEAELEKGLDILEEALREVTA